MVLDLVSHMITVTQRPLLVRQPCITDEHLQKDGMGWRAGRQGMERITASSRPCSVAATTPTTADQRDTDVLLSKGACKRAVA
jgi:hypothetical protein